MITKKQIEDDLHFLLERMFKNNGISVKNNKRDIGLSSNSIVAIAYGIISIKDQTLPVDISDMQCCECMWEKLPKHRRKGESLKAIEAARNCNYYGKLNNNK